MCPSFLTLVQLEDRHNNINEEICTSWTFNEISVATFIEVANERHIWHLLHKTKGNNEKSVRSRPNRSTNTSISSVLKLISKLMYGFAVVGYKDKVLFCNIELCHLLFIYPICAKSWDQPISTRSILMNKEMYYWSWMIKQFDDCSIDGRRIRSKMPHASTQLTTY